MIMLPGFGRRRHQHRKGSQQGSSYAMTASSSVYPYGSAIAVGAAGMVLAWVSGEASGLLAVPTAVYIFRDRCSRMRSIAICGLALGLYFLVPGFDLPPDIGVYLRFDAFLAAVIAIGLLVRDKKRESSTDGAERQACLIGEGTPGLGSPSSDAAGNAVYASPTIDIDDQEEGEEALRSSEQELRLLIDTIPALVWCAIPNGAPSYLNKRMVDYTGMTLHGSDLLEGGSRPSLTRQVIIHPDELVELERLWFHSVRSGETFSMRHRLRRADGVYRWVDARAEPLHDSDGRIVQWYGVCVDIEDETRMQDALRATQDKLSRASQAASLAELSASIAHEVNQPLAAVIANSHACQRWLSTEPPNLQRARVTVERIIRDANGAAEVVSRIRALFKQTFSTRVSVDLNEVITEVCKLISNDVTKKSISIETDLQENLPLTLVDRVQIQQVLVNLTRNGIDAMESNADYPKSLLIRSRRDGMNEVLVEVRDRGSGVEDVERIFEPFFTTKEKGMGMGLAICRSIIEAHDGRLRATKNEFRGATLTFTIPAYSSESQ
jgi:PAS domain S-box-containing protein